VVMIAEIEDDSFVQRTLANLQAAFRFELQFGLLEVVVPPAAFYPDLASVARDRVFNDSRARVQWRTKQNFDFSFLMAHCARRATFYLQLEDDLVAKPGYFSAMRKYAQAQRSQWMMIEFSRLGFIGKLFRCSDLPLFVNFFLMFASDKPIDWLYDIVFNTIICNPGKSVAHCIDSKKQLVITHPSSLFQHMGTHSSLKGKVQTIKDKHFYEAKPLQASTSYLRGRRSAPAAKIVI